MEFKIKDIFVKAAGLKEGVHFAEKVGGVKLEIVGNQKKDDLVPIILRKEGKNFLVDIPDAVVKELKHRDGSEIDLVPDGSIYIL